MAGKVIVARVEAKDRADWERLWSGWQTHFQGCVPAEATARSWDLMMTPGAGLHGLLARSGGNAIGFANVSLTPFAWTGESIVFLQDLYVDPVARGQGAGVALLEGVYSLADALQAPQVFWMVDADDPELQAFYERRAVRTPYLRYMRRPWPW